MNITFMVPCITNLIFVSFQRNAADSSLYFISLQDLSTCFGCSLNPSSGVVAYAALNTPDDECKEHPKHVERSCSEIK
jgi:hypothetical protein